MLRQHRCLFLIGACLKTTSITQNVWEKRLWESDKAFCFRSEPLLVTPCWHYGLHYCQGACFLKGHTLCGSLLCQGFSGCDTYLSSIKIAAELFFCLAQTQQSLGGNALWVLSLFQDILQPFLVIQYQNSTLYSCTPPCLWNQQCWCSYNCDALSQFSLPVSAASAEHIFTTLQTTLVSSMPPLHPANILKKRYKPATPPQGDCLLVLAIVCLCSHGLASGDNG